MRLSPFIFALAGLTFFFAAAPTAQAEDSPKALLETSVNEVLDLLHQENGLSLEDKRQKALELMNSRFSFQFIVRRAFGRNWSELDAAQQERVVELISGMLVRAYARELSNGPKPKMNFSDAKEIAKNRVEISSRVSYRANFVTVDYRLAKLDGAGWQVYDVLVEGISMVSNYRKQFDEHFQTRSAEELITVLERKLAEYGS